MSMSLNQCNKVGVRQGSIVGPLLFLIYVNTILNSAVGLGLIGLFADDIGFGIDEGYVKHNLILAHDRPVGWHTANRLALNSLNTKFWVYIPRRAS